MKNTVKNITIIAQDIGADNHGIGNSTTAFDITGQLLLTLVRSS